MDDEQLMGVSHDIPEGDAVMQDAPHGDVFGTGFGDTSYIMTMLKNMKLRQDEQCAKGCRR